MASTDPGAGPKKIKLRSSDGELFEVDEAMALEVRTMIEEPSSESVIPLPNVSSKVLAKVIEFANYHIEAQQKNVAEEEIKQWDKEFVNVDQATLFELISAANYLNMKSLLDLTCLTVAEMIKGKTPEEIRQTFNISGKFTPEEEEEVRRENPWAFE